MMSESNHSQATRNNPIETELICPRCRLKVQVGELICPRCSTTLTSSTLGKTRQVTQTDRAIRREAWPQTNGPVSRSIVLECPTGTLTLQLEQAQSLVLGRISKVESDRHPDIDLNALQGAELGVSRWHVRMMRNILIYVMDLGSSNGTYINGQRLLPNMDYVLGDGDELRLGKLKFQTKFVYSG